MICGPGWQKTLCRGTQKKWSSTITRNDLPFCQLEETFLVKGKGEGRKPAQEHNDSTWLQPFLACNCSLARRKAVVLFPYISSLFSGCKKIYSMDNCLVEGAARAIALFPSPGIIYQYLMLLSKHSCKPVGGLQKSTWYLFSLPNPSGSW